MKDARLPFSTAGVNAMGARCGSDSADVLEAFDNLKLPPDPVVKTGTAPRGAWLGST